MKKVININFQGRVIPIEETAYDMLKQYVDSLRLFFANEEGRDEIINDIEGRIAELFGETLKKGSTCITDEDVQIIIASMGRPEDFEADEAKVHSQLGGENTYTNTTTGATATEPRGRLYRNENDKMIGGVCAGIAHYLRVDPTIVRILFAVITFGGFGTGFLIYIILWILLPTKVLTPNLKKRLFRNPDDKVLGGVCGGLAAYFNIAVWIPRLIFALPLIVGITSSVFSNMFFEFDPFPAVVFGSFGSTLTIIYVILWIVIPEAITTTEKLEMRGEKVDLNSIKATFKEEMEGIRNRAEKVGTEFKQKATAWGEDVRLTAEERSKTFAAEAAPIARKTSSRVGNAIGILFKAFFLFIAGIVVFVLLMVLVGLMVGGVSVFPLKDFFLEGFYQNFLAWATLLLFLGVPVVAFITWITRRIIGVKSKNKYLGYTFGGLWTIGLFCGILLAASIINNFSTAAPIKNEFPIAQPTVNKMVVTVADNEMKVYGRWLKMDGLISLTEDSLYLNKVMVRIMRSADSAYHTYITKISYGSSYDEAINNARNMSYNINQQDSVLYLSRGFAIPRGTKFKNQGVVVNIQVPVGKRILIDNSVHRRLNWFNIDSDYMDDDWENYHEYRTDVEYVMTPGGLERVNEEKERNIEEDVEELNRSQEELRREIEEQERQLEEKRRQLEQSGDTTYRYRRTIEEKPTKKSKKVEIEVVAAKPSGTITASVPATHMASILRFID